jgi:tRNA(Ile2) C34 agmatinyltransferase TiaS
MTFKLRAAAMTGLAILGTAAPTLAHHSFAAEYDSTKTVTIKGTVNKLSWVNPHAYVFIDVKDASGKVTTWAFESLSPNALSRQGWNRNSLKQGEEVTVEGYMAKDGKPLADGSIHANSRAITRSDGRKVFVGSSADDVPSK